MDELLDLSWFLSTPFGAQFVGVAQVDEDFYETAFTLAENQLKQVKCFCPKIYPTALSIKISLIMQQMISVSQNGASASGENSTGKVALVIEDRDRDISRKYELVDEAEQISKSSPASMLQDIIDSCKNPLRAGSILVKSLPERLNCSCSPHSINARFGDKALN